VHTRPSTKFYKNFKILTQVDGSCGAAYSKWSRWAKDLRRIRQIRREWRRACREQKNRRRGKSNCTSIDDSFHFSRVPKITTNWRVGKQVCAVPWLAFKEVLADLYHQFHHTTKHRGHARRRSKVIDASHSSTHYARHWSVRTNANETRNFNY